MNRLLRFGFLLFLPVLTPDRVHAVTLSPAAVNDLTASTGAAGGEIRLTWTAAGDDIWNGDISGGKFAVHYATYAVSFDRNLAQVLVSTDMVAMSRQAYTIPGLSPGVTYYFALWTRDEVPVNWSGVSNTTSAWAQLGTVSTPTAPGALSALALSSYSLHLGWTDNSANEMGYRVMGSTPSIKAVLPADTTYYIETGLLPNTSYYRAAEVFNSAGAAQGDPAVRYTLSNPSSGTYISSRSSWTAGIAWQANGNPAATRWGVERSTDNFATYSVLVSSTDALTVRNYLDTGLADLTTYYYRVNSFNEESFASGYGAAVSTVTLSTPTAPGGLSGVVLGVSSVSWTWDDNAYNETSYRLRTSTGGLIAVLAAGATAYVETGLGGNQTCARTVEAYNGAGYAVSAGTTSYTLSAPPTGTYVSSRSSWTVGLAWAANTNSAATRWGVERSTDNFATYSVLVSSTDALTVRSYLDTGLTDLSTYYYRVNSFNAENFVSDYGAPASTFTLSPPAAPSGLSNLAVSPYSIEYNWADNAYNEDGYRIRSSTGVLYLLPADATYYAEAGLIPNTSYYREVEAYNGSGAAGAAYAVLYTSAAEPSGLSVIARSSWSVLLGWQSGGNSSGTVWGIERSLTPGFASSTTLKTSTENYTALTYLDTGLSNMVQYFYHVRGFNGDGFSGPYSLTVSTITLSTPTVPAGFSGEALAQDSIRWAWTDASNNEDGFNLRNNAGALVANKPPGSSFHTETGLSPNLPYIRYIEVYNGAGSTSTAKISVNTLSAVPLISPGVDVTSYSVRVSWGLNGNPAGTFWGIERSTDAFATVQVVKVFEDYYSALEYLDTSVLPNTLYYYRVKSYNNAGFESATAGAVGMTLPAIVPDVTPPAGVTDLTSAQGQVGGEIRLSWMAPGDDDSAGDIAGGSLKIHYVTSSTVPLNINLAQIAVSTDMIAGSTQTYSVYGLSPGATYYLGLWIRDEAPTNWSALSNKTTALAQIPPFPEAPVSFTGEAVSTFSIRWSWTPGLYQDGYRLRNGAGGLVAALPVSATSYVETGLTVNTTYTRYVQVYNFTGAANSAQTSVHTLAAPPAGFGPSLIGYSSITVSWTANGNPAGALYRLQRWDAQTATTTLDMTVLSASFTGLAEASTYYFRVGAVNHADLVSWSSASLTVTTLGLPRTDTGLPAESGIHLELAQASGLTLVDIPPGAFSVPLVITLKTPLNYPSDAAPRPGRPAAAGLEILTDRDVQPGKPVVITITYSDADVAGLNPARLAIARYDTARGAWLALPSSADPANHRVTAQTTHFSLFRLFEVNPSLTVLNSRVYPNPFRPSAGHTGVNFDGLPGEAVLKIYAFDGSKVRVLKCNASGVAVWDGKNSSGRDAASGLYFAYSESGSDSKIMTVVVQR